MNHGKVNNALSLVNLCVVAARCHMTVRSLISYWDQWKEFC